MNRLASEARHRAEGYWLTSRLSPLAAAALMGGLIGKHDYRLESWRQPVVILLGSALSWLMQKRWEARMVWLRDTERWWEKLDEAPTIMPFPRLSNAVNRLLDRFAQSRVGRMRLWNRG